jgi:hypothetical protein
MASLNRFISGSMIIAKETVYGSTVIWHDGLNEEVDRMHANEVMTVVGDQDEYGWIRVLTPRGVVGYVHRTNVTYPVEI